MTTHIIELVIVAIILIALYIVSKRVDGGLKFLKKEIDYIEKDIEKLGSEIEVFKNIRKNQQDAIREVLAPINDLFKEPSFKDKVKNEEKRLKDIAKCYKCDAPFQKHHKLNDVEGKFYHTNCIPKVATKKVKK